MTSEQLQQIFDRITTDDAFCDELGADPRATVAKLGVTLTDNEHEAVQGMTRDELRTFATEFRTSTDPSKRRASC